MGEEDDDGKGGAARVVEEVAEVAADWHTLNMTDVQNERGTHLPEASC